MVNPDSVRTGISQNGTQTSVSTCHKGDFHQPNRKHREKSKLPLAYYEQLMQHDYYVKVHHRVRQRGWGW